VISGLRREDAVALSVDDLLPVAGVSARESGYTRTYYSYPTKFRCYIPRRCIELLTKPGDLVVDPYLGGGTTALEAMLLERDFVGYDLNPLALLISCVKCTKLDSDVLRAYSRDVLLDEFHPKDVSRYFTDDDVTCFGLDNAVRAAAYADAIFRIDDARYRDFFLLALIHSMKVAGSWKYDPEVLISRDRRSDLTDVMSSLFSRKVAKMIKEVETLPPRETRLDLIYGSNHRMDAIFDGSVNLIVTSPHYKDVHVEYAWLQWQRPSLHRNKRSDVLSRLLDFDSFPQRWEDLSCGRGDGYWPQIRPLFREAHRILKDSAYAIWVIGFKTEEDHRQFLRELAMAGFSCDFELVNQLPDHGRVAAGRLVSKPEKKRTLMVHDYIIVTRKWSG
jgi:hypothetical protein